MATILVSHCKDVLQNALIYLLKLKFCEIGKYVIECRIVFWKLKVYKLSKVVTCKLSFNLKFYRNHV